MKTLRYMMDGRVLVMLDPDDIEIAVLHLSEGMTKLELVKDFVRKVIPLDQAWTPEDEKEAGP